MKNTIIVLMITLAATIVFGLILKGNLASDIRSYHKLMALLSVLLGVFAAAASFVTHTNNKTKGLLLLTLLLILSAAMGGRNAASAINYNISYLQMVGSTAVALLSSYFALKEIESN
ncbi:hypothetical protein KC644_01400 [Candidatus Berkelbacteria bacterium]|nr:hypothetical protein [Candidatus Berkelbacteria bacterium]